MAAYEREEETTVEAFDGSLNDMRDTVWVASADLENKGRPGHHEKVVTIARVLKVKNAKFKGGRVKKVCHAIDFVGEFDGRMLAICAENRETLKSLFGNQSTDLPGKKIVLYVDPKVQLMGKITNGVRIKPYVATKATAKDAELTPEEAKYVEQVTADISAIPTLEMLSAVGDKLKDKSEAVRAALKPVWAARNKALKEQATPGPTQTA